VLAVPIVALAVQLAVAVLVVLLAVLAVPIVALAVQLAVAVLLAVHAVLLAVTAVLAVALAKIRITKIKKAIMLVKNPPKMLPNQFLAEQEAMLVVEPYAVKLQNWSVMQEI